MTGLLIRCAGPLGVATLFVMAGLSAALALTRGRLADARTDLRLEQARHETDIATFKTAQAKAEAAWQAEITRVQTENRRLNDEADRKAESARADYAARVLQLPTADSGLSGRDALPGAGSPPRRDGPGDDSILLARADAMICADNTARLQAAHDWALGLATRPTAPAERP